MAVGGGGLVLGRRGGRWPEGGLAETPWTQKAGVRYAA